MMKVMGSFSCAALHSAWMEYMAEPSPMMAITFFPGLPSAMPTAAGKPCPSPPLAQVKNVSLRRMGRCSCIGPRVLGASSTMMESGARKSASVCSRKLSVSGSAACSRAARARPRCCGRRA